MLVLHLYLRLRAQEQLRMHLLRLPNQQSEQEFICQLALFQNQTIHLKKQVLILSSWITRKQTAHEEFVKAKKAKVSTISANLGT